MSRTATVIIPARLGSTRLPEKPLQEIDGKPLIVHVCERVTEAQSIKQFVVATDSDRIRDAVEAAGYRAVMTSPDHPTGTDRIAEAARALPGEVVINVQGDEPFLPPELLDRLAQKLIEDPAIGMGTLTVPLSLEDRNDPNVVKVVVDTSDMALYFSRAPIPFDWNETKDSDRYRMHVGIYAFQREVLNQFIELPRSSLEIQEGLEQLRALENGIRLYVAHGSRPFHGVETEEDLLRAREMFARKALTTGEKE